MFKQDGAHESPAKITIPILQDFTKIPNTLLDALCGIRIPGEVRQVLDAIVRNTLGWSRSEAEISMTRLSEITGIKTPNVARCIRRLENMGIIISSKSKHICSYGINLNVSQWRKKQKKTDTDKIDTGKIKEIVINLDTLPIIKTDNEILINLDNPLIKSKDNKESKAKQSEKLLACLLDNAEKAQATATTPATVPEPEPPAAAPPEPLAEIPATPVQLATVPVPAQTAKEVFQSLFDVAVPGSFTDLDAISEMVRRKQAGKLNAVKNPLGYLNSLSGKIVPSIAMPAPVQQTTSGISFFVTEPPRMDHAEMAKINVIWNSMTIEERKLYETAALPKFEQQTGRYKTPLNLLARGIFNSEHIRKRNAITNGVEI
jgi:phage replication O-like protein O